MNKELNSAKEISDDLLKEKSLWAVYRLTWKLNFPWEIALPPIALFCLLAWFAHFSHVSTDTLVGLARKVLELGISVITSLLGFLIAGFTIFATFTNPKLFVKLSTIQINGTPLTGLKTVFSVFMHSFAHYTSFLVSSIFVQIIAQPKGPLSLLIYMLSANPNQIKRCLAGIGFALISSWLLYLVLLVSRFIFNIYSACMFSIIAAREEL